jgi:antitoxin (DNA-binding transcriptional repressor) of toxin-antitoxin stability system
MDIVSASDAKQGFGSVLDRALTQPVGIEKHGKLVAAVVPAAWLAHADLLDERRQARAAQRQVELARLMAHQRLAIDLLARPDSRRKRLAQARREVRRWQEHALCSQDYIDRWNAWLALPVTQLAERMCSDADGWGTAMRQNSPFSAAFP